MGNLGWYQILTTIAKKVGGPKVLIGGIAVGGYLFIRPVEALAKKAIKILDKKVESGESEIEMVEVIKDATDSNGVEFKNGDKIRIIATIEEDNAALIDKTDDPSSPYFISLEFLKCITDYSEHS